MLRAIALNRATAWLLAAALLLVPALCSAQTATAPAVAEPPVRYDTDLLPNGFHKGRRDSVLASLPPNAVAVVLGAPERTRENDVLYEFHQASDLYYLTGATESGTALILAPGGVDVDGERVRELLLVPDRDPAQEVWTGRRLGAERAERELGVAKAVVYDRFEEVLAAALANGRRLHHLPLPGGVERGSTLGEQVEALRRHAAILDFEQGGMADFLASRMLGTATAEDFRRTTSFLQRVTENPFPSPPLREAYTQYRAAATADEWLAWKRDHIDARYADGAFLQARLTALRTVKTDAELALMRHAIEITAEAHREAMRAMRPGMHEYEVEALIEYVFHRNGAEHPGFPSIVGSGENAVILHYETNRRQMQDGDVVVMDIGAEYHGYSADVTRTVPVNGRFTPEQRSIYEIVLRAQEAGIQAVREGTPFGDVHRAAAAVVAQGLRELGLIESDQEVRRFFMHGTSHYLGLYVHDVGTGGPLLPGTVITVEPGIYIAPAEDVDPKWWNIGVRIEDDVLVTEAGAEVLSAGAPRTIADIEALMRQ